MQHRPTEERDDGPRTNGKASSGASCGHWARPYIAQSWPPGHIIGWEHTFVHQFQDFLEAIAEKRQPEPSFAAGLAAQAVLHGMSVSAESHSWAAVRL